MYCIYRLKGIVLADIMHCDSLFFYISHFFFSPSSMHTVISCIFFPIYFCNCQPSITLFFCCCFLLTRLPCLFPLPFCLLFILLCFVPYPYPLDILFFYFFLMWLPRDSLKFFFSSLFVDLIWREVWINSFSLSPDVFFSPLLSPLFQ